MLAEKSLNAKGSLEWQKWHKRKYKIVWELKREKKCKTQVGNVDESVLLRWRKDRVLEPGKKAAKYNGKSKIQGSNFTEEKVEENKEHEIRVLRDVIKRLGNQKQNIELINMRKTENCTYGCQERIMKILKPRS